MHPFLTRLGVQAEVQCFFQPFYQCDVNGNLLFTYGLDQESFGFAFHRVPDTELLWIAGNSNFHMIRQVFICASALEAIAYLAIRFPAFRSLDNLLFISTGVRPKTEQINWINRNLGDKEFTLVFGKDILGRVCDLKVAAGISRIPVAVFLLNGFIHVDFRFRNYIFKEEGFSLNAFEKKAGYRFNTSVQKAREYDSYLTLLKINSFLPP